MVWLEWDGGGRCVVVTTLKNGINTLLLTGHVNDPAPRNTWHSRGVTTVWRLGDHGGIVHVMPE